MTTPASLEQEKNWRVAREINRATRAHPNSPYEGKFVGVWNQAVVTVGASLEEACAAMKAMGDPAASECCVIEASADYEAKVMFWSWA